MHVLSPVPASVLRHPSPEARCTCEHWIHCGCTCHQPGCDPGEELCDIGFLPDDGGLTSFGCARCTPGDGTPHYLGCELIGWHVPIDGGRLPR